MLTCDSAETWTQFLEYVKKRCSVTAFENWLAPIKVLEANAESVRLEVPNIFVKAYLLDNYKKDLCAFLPCTREGEPSIEFVVPDAQPAHLPTIHIPRTQQKTAQNDSYGSVPKLNPFYLFDTFIEGPSNQFVKSAAMGVAAPARKIL